MKKKFMWFFAPEGDGDSTLSGINLDEPTLTEEGDAVPSPEGGDPTPDPEPKPGFDADAMAKAFATSLKDAGFAPAAPVIQPAKPMDPAEAKKLLNVWEPTKEWQVRYDNLETREAALGEMRDGLVKQSDTITQYRLNQLQQSMEAQYAPVRQLLEQQQAEKVEQQFNGTYPELAKPEMKPLVAQVIASLTQAKSFKPGDLTGNFKLVADSVQAVIRSVTGNADFKITPKGSTPTGQTRNNNALRPTTSGSGGGSGGKPPAATTGKSKVVGLLEA